MEIADLTFEEAKLRIADKLKKLKDLDDIRRKLNEQLFILDLQQEVSIKRYKKYLQMIGEHQQQENNRYISLQNLDESNSFRSVENFLKSINEKIPETLSQKIENEKISNLKIKLDQYKIFLNQKKEIYFNYSKQVELTKNVLDMLTLINHSKKEIVDNDNNIPEKQENASMEENEHYSQLESILNQINDQQAQIAKLQITHEGLFREVTAMAKIEKEMQNQLIILQDQASSLVKNRKWHPNFENNDLERNTDYTIFNSSLSIP